MTVTPIRRAFTSETFDQWLGTYKLPHVQALVFHGTGLPTREMRNQSRANGVTILEWCDNLWHYWTEENGWHAGPHFVCDDEDILACTPPNIAGVGSPSWNGLGYLHLESAGDWNKELFWATPTALNVIGAMASVFHAVGVAPTATNLKFHNEDPATTHRDCPCHPGVLHKDDFIRAILAHPNWKRTHT